MKWKPDRITVLLLIVLVFVAHDSWTLRGLHDGITDIIHHYEEPMQTATSTVTNQANVAITITTTRNEGETDAAWLARHVASVAAAAASGGDE